MTVVISMLIVAAVARLLIIGARRLDAYEAEREREFFAHREERGGEAPTKRGPAEDRKSRSN